MPFIDIGFEKAQDILLDTTGSLVKELIQSQKLNPLEGELLENVALLHRQKNQEEAERRIREILEEKVGEEAKRAYERLQRFATHNEKRVSWVLFSRTIQFLPFEMSNPLEGYQQRSVEIVKVQTIERLVKKTTL